jgi:hypothetical protein
MYSFSLAQEIATLRKEAQAFKSVRTALRSNTQNTNAAKIVFQKVLPLPFSRIFRLICIMFSTGVQCRHQKPIEHGRHVAFALAADTSRF